MQVQAALSDPSKLSHLAIPAQGLAQGAGTGFSPAQGLHSALPGASWQPPAGALIAATGKLSGEATIPVGNDCVTMHYTVISFAIAAGTWCYAPDPAARQISQTNSTVQ